MVELFPVLFFFVVFFTGVTEPFVVVVVLGTVAVLFDTLPVELFTLSEKFPEP